MLLFINTIHNGLKSAGKKSHILWYLEAPATYKIQFSLEIAIVCEVRTFRTIFGSEQTVKHFSAFRKLATNSQKCLFPKLGPL